MNEAVYERLKDAARQNELVFYGEIAQIAHINLNLDAGRGALGRLLGEISRREHESGRPLLSVVAVNKDTQFPSQGFFDLAQEVGKYEGHSPTEALTFYATELKAAFDYWSTH
ncbi:MAG: hypothetical protein IPO91_32030 [Chloroflexi bacterium]|nr:hypothetical protein [Chloroflexota bacterium]